MSFLKINRDIMTNISPQMKKTYGSLVHILSVLSFLTSLINFFLMYNALRPCVGICTAEYIDWKEPMWYGIMFLAASVILYFLGNRFKNSHA